MVVNFKLVLLMLSVFLITIVGALAAPGDGVDLKKIYVEEGELKIEYVPVVNGSGLVSCSVLIDNNTFISNVISSPNKLNRISQVSNFAEGEYEFKISCVQDNVVYVSGLYLLKFTDDPGVVVPVKENDGVKTSFFSNKKEVFFTVIVLIAAFIIIKSLIPKVDKKKNKRLRRFA